MNNEHTVVIVLTMKAWNNFKPPVIATIVIANLYPLGIFHKMIHPAFWYYQKRIMWFYLGKIVPERKQFFMYCLCLPNRMLCVMYMKAHNPFNWSRICWFLFVRQDLHIYAHIAHTHTLQYCSVQFPLLVLCL